MTGDALYEMGEKMRTDVLSEKTGYIAVNVCIEEQQSLVGITRFVAGANQRLPVTSLRAIPAV